MGAFNWLNDAIDRFNYVGNDGAVEGILIPEGEEGNMSVAGKPISAIISEPLTYCGDAFFSLRMNCLFYGN
ncbi:hypothetical protein X546_25475 [Brevibacillus borstelensis cifa_chp40]|nr:hypothetical protein X546_25475 [Brevibacillus borstelensis cifa_chp40]